MAAVDANDGGVITLAGATKGLVVSGRSTFNGIVVVGWPAHGWVDRIDDDNVKKMEGWGFAFAFLFAEKK